MLNFARFCRSAFTFFRPLPCENEMMRMTSTDILNMSLYRPLRDAYPEDIFPQVHCRSTDLGDGDTFFSVEQMATVINTYYKQCEKIAQKLKRNSLYDLSSATRDFVFWHYQYKADGELQQLRSPACAWKQRKQGIDCKSYSIIVGSILKCLGVGFYIRQIKQPKSLYPNQFSHVYIVVPKDQKNYIIDDKKNKTDYYVIDGTIPTMNEIVYSDKSDYLIPAMKHIALNGAYLSGSLTPTYTPDFSFNSGVSSSVGGESTTSRWQTGVNTGLNYVKELIGIYGSWEAAKRGINLQAGTEVIPSSVQNESQFMAMMQQQNQQTQQQMMALLSAIVASKGNPDYTPYIIGGVVLVLGVVGVVLLSNSKK